MTRDDFRLEKTLIQYTPLLHFQGEEEGACLRPSEVKPMLDRFIVRYLDERGAEVPAGWKLDAPEGRTALRYKLHIRARGRAEQRVNEGTEQVNRETRKLEIKPSRDQDRNAKIHPMYFGAMGIDNYEEIAPHRWRSRIKSVMYRDGHTLTILVMTKETVKLGDSELTLTQLLDRLLPPFFAMHCFGTRSGKGFGSFGIKGETVTPGMLAEYLPEGVPALYWVEYPDEPDEKVRLDDVNTLSMLMKSGFNYTGGNRNSSAYFKGMIIRYFLAQDIRSDKAAIKQFVLPGPEDDTEGSAPRRYHYVRGLLGTTQTYEFRDAVRRGKVDIAGTEIENKKPKIGRFGNPVHFKPHGSYLFLIPQPIPGAIPGAEFEFSGYGGSVTLSIPDEKAFSLDAFLQYVAETYQAELRDRNSNLYKLRTVPPSGPARSIAATLKRVQAINRAADPRKGES